MTTQAQLDTFNRFRAPLGAPWSKITDPVQVDIFTSEYASFLRRLAEGYGTEHQRAAMPHLLLRYGLLLSVRLA